jgi:hypothetical protein
MRTIDEIRTEIERASERRADLYRVLSKGHDPALAAELKEIGARIDALWDEQRAVRAELRFGPRDIIRKRARAEERLERAA